MVNARQKIWRLAYGVYSIGLVEVLLRASRRLFSRSNEDVYARLERIAERKQAGDLQVHDLYLPRQTKNEQELADCLFHLISTSFLPGSGRTDAENNFLAKLNTQNRKYSVTYLAFAECICLLTGHIYVSGLVRQTSIRLLLKDVLEYRHIPAKHFYKTFWSFIYAGRAAEVITLPEKLRMLPRLLLKRDTTYKTLLYVMGLTKSSPPLQAVNKLKSLIENKNIAIIGPAPDAIDCNYINSNYDYIIYINYKGKAFLPEERKELRIDISYYNGATARHMEDAGHKYLDDLAFAVLKWHSYPFLSEMVQNGRASGLSSPSVSGTLFQGYPHMLPFMLVDTMVCSPSEIYMAGFDLFLSPETYLKGYSKRSLINESDKPVFLLSFSQHNIISQHDFMRTAYQNGVFKASERMAEVLNMETSEYLHAMDKLCNM